MHPVTPFSRNRFAAATAFRSLRGGWQLLTSIARLA
jgi:hypothetical protein